MSPAPEASTKATSTKQTEANRENAKHSTGPRTENAKQRTRLNGLRHGLTSHQTVMPWEDRKEHDKFVGVIIESWAPAEPREAELATTIAEDQWRIARIRAIETNVFSIGARTEQLPFQAHPSITAPLVQAQTYLHNAKELNLLSIYDQRIARKIKLNSEMLEKLQSARKAAEAQALEDAALLAQLAEMKEETPFNPEENGFAFSSEKLARYRDRKRRLQLAYKLNKAADAARNPNKQAPRTTSFAGQTTFHRTA
jgi:hypothetical protein